MPVTDDGERAAAWFAGRSIDDIADLAAGISTGSAAAPAEWPKVAIEAGVVADETEYGKLLHRAAITAAESSVEAREGATDRQLVHAIRTLDDIDRVTNELAERVTAWAATTTLSVEPGRSGIAALADQSAETPVEARIVALSAAIETLVAQREALEVEIDRSMHDVAPNLTAIAGPILGARLLSLAGDLETLAKSPSGTIQVLGAEDALFAHLRGEAPSPKHGIIFTHPYVHETHPDDRGSAARALAGKLAIAARIDHYTGTRRPSVEADLVERIQTIRERRR